MKMRDRSSILHASLKIIASALWLLTAASVASFSPVDWPSHAVFPHAPDVHNWIGPAGSFASYHLLRHTGEGAYVLLFFTGIFLLMKLWGHVVGDAWLRIVGLAFLTVTVAAAVRMISPGTSSSLPEGNGGLIGIAAQGYLRSHFSVLGTSTILFVLFALGLLLVADELVLRAPMIARGAYERMRQGMPQMPAMPGLNLPAFKFPPMPRLPSLANFRTKDAASYGSGNGSGDGLPHPSLAMVNNRQLEGRESINLSPVIHVKPKGGRKSDTKLDSGLDQSNAGQSVIPSVMTPIAMTPGEMLNQRAAELQQLDDTISAQSRKVFDPEDISDNDDLVALDYASSEVAGADHAGADQAGADAAHAEDELPSEFAMIPPLQEQQPIKAIAKLELRKDLIVRLPNSIKPKTLVAPPPKELDSYNLPGWDVLAEAEHGFAQNQEQHVREKAALLEQALREFGVDAHVVEIDTGPVITMYEIALAPGIKVGAITSLHNDIARSLSAMTIRIVAPVPGKNTVGIEVPNDEKEKVRMKELMQIGLESTNKMAIPLFLGKDASGQPLISDLSAMPHVLIAGTTGSGKSVCINSIIMSIMYTQRPDMVKMILVDPKVVEMAPFRDIPHLMCPVITESAKATAVLEWACTKMDERYGLLAEAGVRNIKGYNSLTREDLIERFGPSNPEEEAKIPKKIPYIVIIIDELADLMMTSGKEVESHIVRIAQKARAVGIHLVVATQRPQATVVTGLIKSNLPTKIAFRVNSRMDSRIVLDQNGGELLLGQGDMLFMPPGASKPMRSQGTYIDDKEIRDSVKLVKSLADAQYEPDLIQIKSIGAGGGEGSDERDDLFDDAVRVVLETKRGSVSLLQRRLTIGYGRASRIIEQMSEAGILGEHKGSQAREPMISLEEWEAMQNQQHADAASGMTV